MIAQMTLKSIAIFLCLQNSREFYFDEFLKNSFDGTPNSADFVHVIRM